MLIYTVEKQDKTIGVFENLIDLLLFLYLHQGEFEFDDRGEDLYTMLRSGEPYEKLNLYVRNANIKKWDSGHDDYAEGEDSGKTVRVIASKLPDISWNVTMNDDTHFNVIAPLMPLAVEKAHTEHILEHDAYSGVREIEKA